MGASDSKNDSSEEIPTEDESTSQIPFSNELQMDRNIDMKSVEEMQCLLASKKLNYSFKESLNLEPFPTPHTLAIFANLAYKRTDSDILLPNGWELLTMASSKSGYCGLAVYNPERKQVVISHKGTDDIKSLVADLNGVYRLKYTGMMNSAITFVHNVLQATSQIEGYHISITGHSLGGWLAQITTLVSEYFIFSDGLFKSKNTTDVSHHVHTLVFESPGSKEMLDKIIDSCNLRFEKKMFPEELDITTYLNAPNRVNTFSHHVGVVYRVLANIPEIKGHNWWDREFTINSHSMDLMEQFFSNSSGQLVEVLDWPFNDGIHQSKEYIQVKDASTESNKYNPTKRIHETNKDVIRYHVKDIANDVCSVRILSRDEKNFLESLQNCRTSNVPLNDLEKLISELNLDSLETLVPDFEINDTQLQSKDLENVIRRTKQIMKLNSEKFTTAIKTQVSNISNVTKIFEIETSNYTKTLLQINIKLKDFFGLESFLNSPKQRLMCASSSNTEFQAARLYKIIKQLNDSTKNTESSDIREYVSNTVFMHWKQMASMEKFIDLKKILCTRTILFVLVCPTSNNDDEDIHTYFRGKFPGFSNQQSSLDNKALGKIIILSNDCVTMNIFQHMDENQKLTKIIRNEIDVESDSLKTMLCEKTIFKGKNETFQKAVAGYIECPETWTKTLMMEHNCPETWIKDLMMEQSIYENLIAESPQLIVLDDNIQGFSDLDVTYSKISRELTPECLVQYIIKASSTAKCKEIFTFSGVKFDKQNVEDFLRILKISKDTEEENYLKQAVDKNIIANCQGEDEDNQYCFRNLCRKNDDKRVYWFHISKKRIFWKTLFDHEFYIERKFNSEISIKPGISELFNESKNIQNDNFIILDNVKDEGKFLKFFNCKKSSLSTSVYVEIANTYNDALKLFLTNYKECNSPVHLLEFVIDNEKNVYLIWRQSRGSLDSLRSYVEMDIFELIDETQLTRFSKNVVIISDKPGMGKSTSLVSLSRNANYSMLIRINFKDQNEIHKLPFELEINSVADYLFKQIKKCNRNQFTKTFLKYNLEFNTRMPVLVLFDGFDELKDRQSDDTRKKYLNLLMFLKDNTKAKVFITTRPYQGKILENTLSQFSVSFKDIREERKVEFLKEYWLSCLCFEEKENPERCNEIIDRYVRDLFENIKSILGESISKFMGIPLQIWMIAQVAQPSGSVLKEKNWQKSAIFDKLKNIFNLYTDFIKTKYDIYLKEKLEIKSNITDPIECCIIDDHIRKMRLIAFGTLFPRISEKYLKDKMINFTNESDDIEQLEELNRVGLIQMNINGEPKLIHRTFGEYFVATLLIRWLKKEYGRHPQKYPKTEEFIFQKILLRPEYKIIRMFLNFGIEKEPFDMRKIGVNNLCDIWRDERRCMLNDDHQTAVHLAVEEALDSVIIFIASGLKIDSIKIKNELIWYIAQRDKSHKTALYNVAKQKNEKILDILLKAVNDNSQIHEILLLASVFRTPADVSDPVVQYILKHIKEKYKNSSMVSFTEALIEKYKVIDEFLDAAKNGNKDKFDSIFNHYKDTVFIHFLVCVYDKNGETALHLAIENNRNEIVDYLFEKNKEMKFKIDIVNAVNKRERTPIHKAAEFNNLDVLEILCQNGGDVKMKDNCLMSAVSVAAKRGYVDIVKFLANNGGDLKTPERNGITPLQHAAKVGHLEMVKYLVSQGCSIEVGDKFGNRALSWAVKNCKTDVVEYLLKENAKIDFTDRFGRNILYVATKAQHWDVVDLLTEKGAGIIVPDRRGITSLHLAISTKVKKEMIKLLTKAVKPIDEMNENEIKYYNSLIKHATKDKMWDFIRVLVEQGFPVQNLEQQPKKKLVVLMYNDICEKDLVKLVNYLKTYKLFDLFEFFIDNSTIVKNKTLQDILKKIYKDFKDDNLDTDDLVDQFISKINNSIITQ